jgi:hypothetical protein
MKTIIHVNRQKIAQNVKYGRHDPAIIVRTYKGSQNAHDVEILGPARIVHAKKPLSCGARVWIETQATVKIHKGKSTV